MTRENNGNSRTSKSEAAVADNKLKQKSKGASKKPTSSRKIAELKKHVKALADERDALKDRLMRTVAEFENYKKRRENDFIQLIASSNADLIGQLLPILDDYERSMRAARESKDFDSFYAGIELIYKNLLNVLEKQGVTVIEAVGQPFDPELHDALLQVDSQEHDSGMVVEEHLRGYKMHDRVLRHAQVIVSK